tara:strand:- start:2749 stop:3159 length:411 start_codon:yes stop_codon:yes gene_type:complete
MSHKNCVDGYKFCVVCEKLQLCSDYFLAGVINGKKYYRRRCRFCYSKTKLNYRKKVKDWLYEYKKGLKCKICGYSKDTHKNFSTQALQFHHKGNNKEFQISDGANHGYSKKRVRKEIKKCSVLCARCHAELHDNEV